MDTKEKTGKKQKNTKQPVNKTEKEAPRPLQDVVYMPPKPFMRNRLLLRLATVGAIVLALVLAMSVFFRVEHIQVSGMDQYTAWDISLASGIHQGDSLFSLELPAAAAKIKELNYVKDVRIGIRLPNMVIIDITEVRVTYAIKAQGDDWWLVDSSGRIIDKTEPDTQENYTKILGVHLQDPKVGEQAVAYETSVPGVDEEGNPIPVTITAAHQLSTALDIADYLESNGIIGQAASIDVNDLGNLQVWYGQQYQIKLGDESQLSYKISMIKSAINELSEESHNSGVLEVRLNDPANEKDDEVKYTRFQ